jgi:hypothetical protein
LCSSCFCHCRQLVHRLIHLWSRSHCRSFGADACRRTGHGAHSHLPTTACGRETRPTRTGLDAIGLCRPFVPHTRPTRSHDRSFMAPNPKRSGARSRNRRSSVKFDLACTSLTQVLIHFSHEGGHFTAPCIGSNASQMPRGGIWDVGKLEYRMFIILSQHPQHRAGCRANAAFSTSRFCRSSARSAAPLVLKPSALRSAPKTKCWSCRRDQLQAPGLPLGLTPGLHAASFGVLYQ